MSIGIHSGWRPGDSCTGVCIDGSCSLLSPVCNAVGVDFCNITEQQATSESSAEVDSTCYRLTPKTTLYSPLTGAPILTIDNRAEVCI